MSDFRIRHCTRCVSDYQQEVIYCVDCGAELVDRYEETDPQRRRMPGGSVSETPPVGARREDPLVEAVPPGWSPIYFASTASDLGPLADRLASRGIELRILSRSGERGADPPRLRFELWVEDASLAAALEDIRDLAGPGATTCGPSVCGVPECATPVAAADFDPRTGYRQCPACGVRLHPPVAECPDCGLALDGEPEDAPGPAIEPT